MSKMLKTFKNIRVRDEDHNSVINGKMFTIMHDVKNEWGKDYPTIYAGTPFEADFAHDGGVYGSADIDGKLTRVHIGLEDLHNINWGEYDERFKSDITRDNLNRLEIQTPEWVMLALTDERINAIKALRAIAGYSNGSALSLKHAKNIVENLIEESKNRG